MKRNTVLHIDSTGTNVIRISVVTGKANYAKVADSPVLKSQMVLPLIENLLKEHSLALSDITGITVKTGPGSFTGIRVGVTVANMLGFILKIPVNGKRVIAKAKYSD